MVENGIRKEKFIISPHDLISKRSVILKPLFAQVASRKRSHRPRTQEITAPDPYQITVTDLVPNANRWRWACPVRAWSRGTVPSPDDPDDTC